MKKPPQVSRDSKRPTDAQNDTWPGSIPSDSTWKPARTTPKPNRATYQAARRAELDQIRRLDLAYRKMLSYLRPLGARGDDGQRDGDDPSRQVSHERKKGEHQLHLCRRVLFQAVEGYLLGCAEYPDLTGEVALRQATSTESLIDLLQAEENLMIRTFAPPWVERHLSFNESSLTGPLLPGARNVPPKGIAPWRWPFR
jgi:hypothetical protein